MPNRVRERTLREDVRRTAAAPTAPLQRKELRESRLQELYAAEVPQHGRQRPKSGCLRLTTSQVASARGVMLMAKDMPGDEARGCCCGAGVGLIYTCRCSVDTVWRGPGPARRCAALFGAAPSWALAPCGGCIPQTVKARVLLFANRHGACRGHMPTTRRPAGAWDVLQPCTAPRQACLAMLRSPAGPRGGSHAPGPHRAGPAPHEPLRLRHMWPSIVRCTLQYWRVHQRFLACGTCGRGA